LNGLGPGAGASTSPGADVDSTLNNSSLNNSSLNNSSLNNSSLNNNSPIDGFFGGIPRHVQNTRSASAPLPSLGPAPPTPHGPTINARSPVMSFGRQRPDTITNDQIEACLYSCLNRASCANQTEALRLLVEELGAGTQNHAANGFQWGYEDGQFAHLMLLDGD
jgi:hypothetical protein